MHVVIAGCQHETNTFSPIKTTFKDFEQADSWPPLLMGNDIFSIDVNANIPIAGFIRKALDYGFDCTPLVWCSATPSGVVTNDAANAITDRILNGILTTKKPIDAIYIDLHGAMVTETHEDYEGFLLSKIREIVGNETHIVASLDLHANVTPLMVEKSDGLIAYRTYPHIDTATTGERAADFLYELNASVQPVYKSFKQLPYLIPMTSQCTMTEPAQSLYQQVTNAKAQSNSLCMGFPLSDTHHTGPTIVSYDKSESLAEEAAKQLYDYALSIENDFKLNVLQPDEAIEHALKLNQQAKFPVILADTQDNPGCGGSCDTTGLLHALVRADVPDATVVMMAVPEIAGLAHARGIGHAIQAVFTDKYNDKPNPISLNCNVIALGDGHMIGSGPFYQNCKIALGPMACLQYRGIKIIVSSKKMQAADQSILHHLQIDPTQEKIIVLKSSVHFRADFSRISSHIFVVESPGLNTADLRKLEFHKLRPGVHI